MKSAIMQPYFFPYIGYYQLVHTVEKFIFLDDVNYIKKGYINRNSILSNGAAIKFSIPVKKISQNRHINMHEYIGDFSEFLKTIEQSYKKSIFFDSAMPLIESILLDKNLNVAQKNSKTISCIFDYLEIQKDFLYMSEINISKKLKGEDRILSACEILGITHYINPIGGQEIYCRENFKKKLITLSFLQSNSYTYPQKAKKFIEGLSIIDVIMNCDKKKIVSLLNGHTLI